VYEALTDWQLSSFVGDPSNENNVEMGGRMAGLAVSGLACCSPFVYKCYQVAREAFSGYCTHSRENGR